MSPARQHARVNTLTAQELALFDQVRAKYNELSPIPCTKCEYCLPCPNGVAIPRVFAAYNEGMMYDKPDVMRDGPTNSGFPPKTRQAPAWSVSSAKTNVRRIFRSASGCPLSISAQRRQAVRQSIYLHRTQGASDHVCN